MADNKIVVASAPASDAITGATTDVSGKGVTLTLALEGPRPLEEGGLRAYAMVAASGGSATSVRVLETDEVTADTLYGTGRLLELSGYRDRPGLAITLNTLIPPQWGLGGASAQLVALLYALDGYFGRQRPPEEIAETAQRATLRPGQAHGYQKAYAATFGGVRLYSFMRKLTGLWGRGTGSIYDEPYATVSESRNEHWRSLGARIVVAIPRGLRLVSSGEINAAIAQRYLQEDKATVDSMDRRTFTALLAHQRLVNRDRNAFWTLVDTDTNIMREWGLIAPEHRRIMDLAHEHGALASKPSSTGGAVIVYCPEGSEGPMAEALREVSETVYPVDIAPGVRYEERWPF
ncbi:MAG: hypothetical protein FJZ90_07890 [Chloroflexi bacterium]|nr:hypothetical protein [Chloroflexota bacterium]